ncbi:MAG: flagellin [Candidatus Cloacimonadota bacterium]|nr:MAG: flagellin [Candidatus Cloacimonadota bacterium]PIE78885.1 MAG: flagellin [Candidatus Delongbacteria bacterium]
MSTRINHNILSMTAQRNIGMAQRSLDTSVNRLSSGLRINNSWEDAAGLAVSEKFRAQISGMVEAERNANYNINMLATAEGSLQVIDEKLIRMRALAVEASNGALTSNDREFIDVEFQQLKSEITRIAQVTNYNTKNLLDGSLSGSGAGSRSGNRISTKHDGNSIKFHIGANNTEGEDYYYVNIGGATAEQLGLADTKVTDTAVAQSAIDEIDNAITSKDTTRTFIGAVVKRLQNNILQLQISHENAQASESQIRDADIAAEMTEFTRAQILFNSGISMLSQANSLPNMVSQLIG